MKIKKWQWTNYKSYGPATNEIIIPDSGELVLLLGKNGNGKCVDGLTEIDIDILDLDITDELLYFLDKTETGIKIFKYIKVNNIPLYEKIINKRKIL